MVSHIGSQTNGMYKFIEMPDGSMKRSFDYKTVLDFNKLSNESDQFFEVNGRLEFSDKDWMNVTKQNIGIKYRVSDVETSFDEMDNYLRKINLLADQKRFVTNDFYGDFLNHLGVTYINMDMQLQPDAITCLFHSRKCEAKGPKAYKFDKKLKAISKIKRPSRKLEKLGKLLRKQIYKPDRFKNVVDFIGRDNISTDLIITGEYFQGKNAIKRKSGPKLPLAI